MSNNKKIKDFSNKPVPDTTDAFLLEAADGTYYYVTKLQLAGSITAGYLTYLSDTAAGWTSNNPILPDGSIGIESDTMLTSPKFKIAFSSNHWNDLPYANAFLSGLTTNKVLKATSSTTAGDSNITDDGTIVIIESPNALNSIYVSNVISGYGYGSNESGSVDTNDSRTNVTHTIKNTFEAPLHEFNNSVTKNGVEVATVNDIPTVDTTIIDGSTNAVSGNAVFDGLATKANNLLAKQNITITHTGTTAETKIYSILIPAGSVQANDNLKILMKAFGVSGVASKSFRMYFNTSDAIGGVQVGLNTIAATVSALTTRNIFCKNSLSSQQVIAPTASVSNEESTGQNAGSYSTISINFAVDQYFIVSCQLTTGTESAAILGLTLQAER